VGGVKPITLYAVGRMVFGVAALVAPAPLGTALAGDGAAASDPKAFLRGMGGREIGLGLGILGAVRTGSSVRPWLVAGVLADSGDLAGIAGAWRHMPREKRWIGVATAGATAATGAVLLGLTW
jgi:hypothetical protein